MTGTVKYKRPWFAGLFILGFGSLLCQTPFLDSLKTELEKLELKKKDLAKFKYDSARCEILYKMVSNETNDMVWPAYNEQLYHMMNGLVRDAHPKHRKYYLYLLGDVLSSKAYLCGEKGDNDQAIIYNEQALKIARTLNEREQICTALNNIGVIYFYKGELKKALRYYEESLRTLDPVKDKSSLFSQYNNLASVYDRQGNTLKAIAYYQKALREAEEIKNTEGIASVYINLGAMSAAKGDLRKSKEYFLKALEIFEERKNYNRISTCLNNLGTVEGDLKNYDAAIQYYQRSLKLSQELNDSKSAAVALMNMGDYYTVTKKYEESLKYLFRALKQLEENGEKEKSARCLNLIASAYITLRQYDVAKPYLLKAMTIANELGYPANIRPLASNLKQVMLHEGNYSEALRYYKTEVQMKDSLTNARIKKETLKAQLKYDYEKEATADSVAHAKENEAVQLLMEKQRSEIETHRSRQYGLFGGLILMGIFSGFIFNRWKFTRRQQELIEKQRTHVLEQKKLVETKQKEVLDSIHYARRIQLAQIPSEKRIESMLQKIKPLN